MKHYLKFLTILGCGLMATSCGSYFNQPVSQQPARTGELSPRTKILRELPMPAEPIVVGVYNFKDQTGQYKSTEAGSTFSTAVPQGATTVLIKALEDSRWFNTIERENLSNLLNERNIIRSTRDEYRKNKNPNEPNLPPLLYAGILLEGGIISYDTNILTGGAGARYFGVGGSTQYRQDRITVYLRAVSTSNGRILKTVYVSKTILSQAVDVGVFRYVNFQRLLEAETGFTKNEPVELALKDAIEKAVESLIIEGIEDDLWSTKDGVDDELIEAYREEKDYEESKLLYDRKQIDRTSKDAVGLSLGFPILNGDYSKKRLGYSGEINYSRRVSKNFSLIANGGVYRFETGDDFSKDFASVGLDIEYSVLPLDDITPVLYAGFGYLIDLDGQNNMVKNIGLAPRLRFGLGVNYNLSSAISLEAFGEQNISFSDELDLVENGKRDDYFYNFGVGIKYHFGETSVRRKSIIEPIIIE